LCFSDIIISVVMIVDCCMYRGNVCDW